jgi:hypothetical protein
MDWKNKVNMITNKVKHQLYARLHDDLEYFHDSIPVPFLTLDLRPQKDRLSQQRRLQ